MCIATFLKSIFFICFATFFLLFFESVGLTPESAHGFFTYVLVVDGLFASALLGELLLQGSYDASVAIVVRLFNLSAGS